MTHNLLLRCDEESSREDARKKPGSRAVRKGVVRAEARRRGGSQRGLAATKPTHRDTEDTGKGGFFKTGSLRDRGVSVVSVLTLASYQNHCAPRRIRTLVDREPFSLFPRLRASA